MKTTRKVLLGSVTAGLVLALAAGSLAWAQGWSYHQAEGWGAGPGAGPGAALIERFDRTGDGRVSQADVDAVRAERFAAFDADGDGVLSLEEYQALWLDAMRPRMVRDFQRLDVDGDARVTEAEFLAPYRRMVERFDRTGDGVITEEDVRQTMRERRSEMRGRSEMGGRAGMQRGDGPRRSAPEGQGRGPRGAID